MSTDCPETPEPGTAAACLKLVLSARVMTLGTAGTMPWTATVYYLYDGGRFYFFSNPEARHINEGLNQACAASLYLDDQDITQLQGIQMAGTVQKAPENKDMLKIALAYIQRFHLPMGPGNVLAAFKSRFRARLYWFEPVDIYYMDNRCGFGTRNRIDL